MGFAEEEEWSGGYWIWDAENQNLPIEIYWNLPTVDIYSVSNKKTLKKKKKHNNKKIIYSQFIIIFNVVTQWKKKSICMTKW